MILSDIYEAIFDPTKCVQFRRRVVDDEGAADYGAPLSDWITINKDSHLTSFIGATIAGGTKILKGFGKEEMVRIIDAEEVENHDGTIVELHGRKYLLTEVKDI